MSSEARGTSYVHFTNLPALFFDLVADPGELNNLIDHPDYQGLVLSFAQKMLSWRMNHDEQTLTHLALTDEGHCQSPIAALRTPSFNLLG